MRNGLSCSTRYTYWLMEHNVQKKEVMTAIVKARCNQPECHLVVARSTSSYVGKYEELHGGSK